MVDDDDNDPHYITTTSVDLSFKDVGMKNCGKNLRY
jgi:hypothetical protein